MIDRALVVRLERKPSDHALDRWRDRAGEPLRTCNGVSCGELRTTAMRFLNGRRKRLLEAFICKAIHHRYLLQIQIFAQFLFQLASLQNVPDLLVIIYLTK